MPERSTGDGWKDDVPALQILRAVMQTGLNYECLLKGDIMQIAVNHLAKCTECDRQFNLLIEEEAEEFYYGHDCEVEE